MSIIMLPGLIDIHVRIRQLESNDLEDFDSVTTAALAGGITMICVVQDTISHTVDEESFKLMQEVASNRARCDYALYFRASDTNHTITCQYITDAACLEMNLDNRYGLFKLNDMSIWIKQLLNWPNRALGPIVCHAESHTMAAIILLAHLLDRRIHISNVTRKQDILLIRACKDRGIKLTCDVCPHHLFLSTDDINSRIYGYDICTPEDQKALWQNIPYIDIFATEHTAYTKKEKCSIERNGFPGLETFLPLLLNAVSEGRLTKDEIIQKCYTNPKRIFNLPEQYNTYITVDLNEEWIIPEEVNFSKAKWTPFAGKHIKGKISHVYLRGKLVYRNNKVLALPGFGENVRCDFYNQFICHCEDTKPKISNLKKCH